MATPNQQGGAKLMSDDTKDPMKPIVRRWDDYTRGFYKGKIYGLITELTLGSPIAWLACRFL